MNCKYCDGEIRHVFNNLYLKIKNEESELQLAFNRSGTYDFIALLKINYCPFCGQKLDKEVFDYYSTD